MFKDLRLKNPEERLAKAQLASQIMFILEERKLTQTAAAKLLGIAQPKVSLIYRGNLEEFSIERLMRLLNFVELVSIALHRNRAVQRAFLEDWSRRMGAGEADGRAFLRGRHGPRDAAARGPAQAHASIRRHVVRRRGRGIVAPRVRQDRAARPRSIPRGRDPAGSHSIASRRGNGSRHRGRGDCTVHRRDPSRVRSCELVPGGAICYEVAMGSAASPRDLAHFAAIAAAEAVSEEERIARAVSTPPGERMVLGIELGTAFPWTPAVFAEIDARTDGQAELARRRIALGLSHRARG